MKQVSGNEISSRGGLVGLEVEGNGDFTPNSAEAYGRCTRLRSMPVGA